MWFRNVSRCCGALLLSLMVVVVMVVVVIWMLCLVINTVTKMSIVLLIRGNENSD